MWFFHKSRVVQEACQLSQHHQSSYIYIYNTEYTHYLSKSHTYNNKVLECDRQTDGQTDDGQS